MKPFLFLNLNEVCKDPLVLDLQKPNLAKVHSLHVEPDLLAMPDQKKALNQVTIYKLLVFPQKGLLLLWLIIIIIIIVTEKNTFCSHKQKNVVLNFSL